MNSLQMAFAEVGFKKPAEQPQIKGVVWLVPEKEGSIAFDVKRKMIPTGFEVKLVTSSPASTQNEPMDLPQEERMVGVNIASFLKNCVVSSLNIVRHPSGSHRVYINWVYDSKNPSANRLSDAENAFAATLMGSVWGTCVVRQGTSYPKTKILMKGMRGDDAKPLLKLSFRPQK
jgi:hypothetical protein